MRKFKKIKNWNNKNPRITKSLLRFSQIVKNSYFMKKDLIDGQKRTKVKRTVDSDYLVF